MSWLHSQYWMRRYCQCGSALNEAVSVSSAVTSDLYTGKPVPGRSRLFTRNLEEDGVGCEYCMFFNKAEKRMVCIFQPGPYLEGPPGYTHGGCIATMIDSTMWTAAIYSCGKLMTANLNINYRNPVPLGVTVVVDSRVDKIEGRKVYASCQVRSHDEETLHTEAIGEDERQCSPHSFLCSLKPMRDSKPQQTKRQHSEDMSKDASEIVTPQPRNYALPNPSWTRNTRELHDRFMRESGTWKPIPSYSENHHYSKDKPLKLEQQVRRRFTRNLDEDGLGFEYCLFYHKSEKRMVCIFQPGPYLEGYPSPVLLGSSVLVDGRVDQVIGRKVYTSCQIRSHDDALLHAEATGLFIKVNGEDIEDASYHSYASSDS
ncbi:uncharacterized protein PAF06_018756 [Gastrophryne carolinensis]